jgi:hypothetical protein
MEIFAAAIAMVGIGIMLGIIRLKAAFTVIALISLGAALLPLSGRFGQHIPAWVFWGVVIILGINLLRMVLGVLFGRNAADNFTGGLLLAVLRPVVALFEGIVRAVFRIR